MTRQDRIEILRKTPIHEVLLVLGKDVRHTRSGLYHSPFREDKTPSFHVDESRHQFSDPGDFDPSHKKPGNKWAGGDVIDLVMWLKGLNFDQALDFLSTMNPAASIPTAEPHQESRRISAALVGYVNHSGGAMGSDTVWGETGAQYGVESRHYYHGRKTPSGNVAISEDAFKEGIHHVQMAASSLGRYGYEKYMDLLSRNWQQVKNADAVFAIGRFSDKSFRAADGTEYRLVDGGTGWAVQMAVDVNKPIYFFDQSSEKWYAFDFEGKRDWRELADAPSLTKNFAGIGTRQITDIGRQAIASVYKTTITRLLSEKEGIAQNAEPAQGFLSKVNKDHKIDIWAGQDGENASLSNMAYRPFSIHGQEFHSVEQYFQFKKAETAGDTNAARQILASKSAWECRKLGRAVDLQNTAFWDRLATSYMEEGIRLSFTSNPEALNELLKTGNAMFTHERDTGRWREDFPLILMKVRDSFQAQLLDEPSQHFGTSTIEIKKIRQGITSSTLLNYETSDRMIAKEVLNRYCSQVDYTVAFSSSEGEKKMTYMAIGFPNQEGGWALRGAPYKIKDGKMSSGIKRSSGSNGYTVILKDGTFADKQAAPSSANVIVFEGFNDFLSWLTWHGKITPETADIVVLNSTAFAHASTEFLSTHQNVFTYLDADEGGRQATEIIKNNLPESVSFKDCADFYISKGHNDLNDAWKAEAKKRISRGTDPHQKFKSAAGDLNKQSPSRKLQTSGKGIH